MAAKMKLLFLLSFILIIFITAPSADGAVSFSLIGATAKSYKEFIQNLRNALTLNGQQVYNIPVLPASGTPHASFITVDLTNYNGEKITLGLYTVNSYVVAFQSGPKSYFLQDIPAGAQAALFRNTEQIPLPYSGSYDRLEAAAKTTREKTDLGFSEISSAIGNMFHYQATSVPRAFIILIQTVAEAARFKYIETRVSQSGDKAFKPDPGFLSLENRWSDLSEQIQIAQTNGGKFKRPIEVRSVSNNPILVTDVTSDVVKGMALLLYYRVGGTAGDSILMSGDVAGDGEEDTAATVWLNRKLEIGKL